MNKFSKITSFLFVLLFFFHVSLKASHIAGGEITYSCLGNNQYKIFLNLYVDCAGISLGTTETINFSSSCGGNATAQLQVTPATTNGFEISQLCPSQVPQSTCNGGVLPGMHLYSYEGIITLAPVCNTWTMSWSTCCRNLAVTNLTSASSSYYIEATLNSQNAICNSSPRFNAQPIPYVCTNQFVSYSYGVTESDGDSLYYQLIPAYVAAGTPANYNGAYSGTSPIPGITINSQTGLITFTSSNIGNFVVVILVTEYDRATQQVLGTIMRDIQFVVLNCTNIVPSPNAGTITNLTGNALQTGPYSIDMCAGNSFNFNAVYTDANAADILTYISNIATALPGATITQVGASTNPLTLNIGWTAPGGSQGQNPTFTVTVSDGACPLQGQQTFVYSLNILFATVASADVTICTSQTAALNVTGGNTFNWVALSGSPISAGNFSCNPCANPVASPSVTTTYEVTSNLSSACTNKDTVTVTVVPDFTFNISQSTATSCLLSPVQLNVTNILPVANGYTYQWSPSTYLNDDTIQNPIATFTVPGTYTYIVTVTNPFGCSKADTITVTALAAASPVITAYSDTSFCLGGTATLGLNFSNINPAYCGLSTSGNCNGTGTPITIGAGISSNTATTYPAPYGNFQKNARHQFLYTAAELIGAGISSGKIDRLDFNVSSIQGTTSYDSYTIKLGCTSVTSLSTWQTGLSQVYNPKTHTVTAGWNAHIFDTAYIWDGVSNLVVDICYDNRTASSSTNNSSSPYTSTAFVSCLYYRSNINVACGTVNPPFTSSNRPNIKFYNCNTVNPSNYTYTWTPATGNIANATQQTTTGQPTANTTYTVTVTDIMNGCTDTDSVNVTLSAVSVNSTTICNGQTASLIANPSIAGGTYLWAPSGGTGATENVSPTTTTTYTVSYTVPGCTITATATVAVDSVFNKNQNFHLCMGQSVTVGSNTYSTTGIYTDSLATYKGCDSILITTLTIDSIISTTINSNICIGNSYMLPNSTFTSLAGLYTDTISSQLGCDSIIITNLTVSSPAIVISPDATIQLGDSIALNASGATSYVWFPGLNLNCINCSGPIASPIATTIYCVAATDSSGCSDTACVTITVESRCDDFTNVGFPNIFTPNNDGNNDVMYFLKGWDVCVESFHVAVYDRWGIIVFESTFPNREWDGRISNGMEAADGVYYYVLKIKNKKGEEEQTKGFINLIR